MRIQFIILNIYSTKYKIIVYFIRLGIIFFFFVKICNAIIIKYGKNIVISLKLYYDSEKLLSKIQKCTILYRYLYIKIRTLYRYIYIYSIQYTRIRIYNIRIK